MPLRSTDDLDEFSLAAESYACPKNEDDAGENDRNVCEYRSYGDPYPDRQPENTEGRGKPEERRAGARRQGSRPEQRLAKSSRREARHDRDTCDRNNMSSQFASNGCRDEQQDGKRDEQKQASSPGMQARLFPVSHPVHLTSPIVINPRVLRCAGVPSETARIDERTQ